MLTEAQIEIVDETGHVEDRVRIVGTGEVALATKDRECQDFIDACTQELRSFAVETTLIFDEVVLYDSSAIDRPPRLVAEFVNGKVASRSKSLPGWCVSGTVRGLIMK
jgi:hypothetical protein